MTPLGKYGPAVIGKEKYEKEQRQIERQGGRDGARFGPAITEEWDQDPDITSVHSASRSEIEDANERVAEGRVRDREDSPGVEHEIDLPPGYEVEHVGGGYYTLTFEGEKIESDMPSGNWGQGVGAAVKAAATHHEESVKQEVVDETAGPEGQVSVDELRGILANDPDAVDNFVHAEVMRSEGPRREALEVLLETEQQKEEPRPEAVQAIESLMADATHGGEEQPEDEE